MKTRVIIVTLLILILLGSYLTLQENESLRGNLSLKYRSEIQGLEQQENVLVTSWRIQKAQTVRLEALNRSRSADIISIYGDTENLLNNLMLYGGNSFKDDFEGCVISRGLSEDLFGVANGTGKYLTYNRRKYVVRGVSNSMNNYLIIHDLKGKNGRYTFWEMKVLSDLGQAKRECDNLLAKYQLNTPEAMIDYNFFVGINELLFLIPIVMILGIGTYKIRKKTNSFWTYIAGIVIIVIIIATNVNFGVDFIPTRWSDFSFWSAKLDYIKQNFSNLNGFLVVFGEMSLHKNILKTICLSTGAIIMIVMYILFDKKHSVQDA